MRTLLAFSLFLLFSLPLFAQDYSCMDCHSERSLTKSINDSVEISVFVDTTQLAHSIHADLECTDCHEVTAGHPNGQPVGEPTCGNCHEDVQDEYALSIHGKAHHLGNASAATCWNCHGSHDIKAVDDTLSLVNNVNVIYTCGQCHSDPKIMKLFGRRKMDPVKEFSGSIHGKIFRDDPNAPVANCIVCHGSHKILPAIEPDAPLNKLNIPKTCGQCHPQEEQDYYQSVHWQSVKRGHYESPVCTDCHGEHNIHLAEGPKSVTSPQLQATKLCANCHSNPVLMERFGLDAHRLDSYMKSYHGLAVLKGSPDAATCTSCHEVHDIRSKSDTLSAVNPKNRLHTCQKCHTNADQEFASIDVHPVNLKQRNPIAYYLKIFYVWMIILVIGGMILHNLIIIIYHIREKRKALKNEPSIQRFQSWEVYQHFFLLVSFLTLAITGFALKFPNAGWVKLLVSIGLDESVRSVIHRIAALIMGTASVIQLIYFVATHRGRRDFLSLIPTRDDLTHVWQNMRFYLGLSTTRPKFGRYDYGEKAEYLALIWGVIVMGATGMVLWFPEVFIGLFPAWLFEASEVVHYFEAWLATLAIFVWHWFFVIYHPEKYPLNPTVFDGKISLEDLKHEHPLEYEEIIRGKED